MRVRSFGLLGLMAVMAVAGCTGEPAQNASPLPLVSVPLTLTGAAAGQTIHIGVLVGPRQGEGAEYRDVADGVRVAAYRFAMTGVDITITAALDTGTTEGARQGLAQLSDAGVAGIIVASAGAHLQEALAQVSTEQPIILPYDDLVVAIDGVWSLAPSGTAVSQVISDALEQTDAAHPYLVTGDSQTVPTLTSVRSESLVADTAGRVIAAIQSGTADSLVVAASAESQARLIAEVQQGLGLGQIPIITTPPARTPLFARTLLSGGAISSTLITIGSNTSDLAALEPGSSGAYAGAFFAALRLAANDSSCLNIFGDAPLATAAQTADMASHDAAIALIRAVEQAGSTSPSNVKAALQGRLVQPEDGLAGPALDFSKASALPDDAVQALYASTQNPGVRPPSINPQPMLVWFPLS